MLVNVDNDLMRWKLGLAVGSAVVVSGLGSAVLFNGVANGEWDFPGLNQQVQHITEVTTNHEARISNLEGKSDTPPDQPTPTPQVVTKVVTQSAPSVASTSTVTGNTAPTAMPVYVSSWLERPVSASCPGGPYINYVTDYSDGTSKTTTYRLPEDSDNTFQSTSSITTCTSKVITP